MDIASRLIFILLLLCSRSVFAIQAIEAERTTVYYCTDPKLGQRKGASPEAACAPFLPASTEREVSGHIYRSTYSLAECRIDPNFAGFTCDIRCTDTDNGSTVQTTICGGFSGFTANALACPANSSPLSGGSGNLCGCDSGYMKQGNKNSCYQYTCGVSGSYSPITQPDQKVQNAGDTLCTGGCGYQPSSWKVGQDGQIWATWPFKSTGSFCGGSKDVSTGADTGEKNSTNPAPIPCGANSCPGTVNGASVCVACKKTVEEGPSSSASSPSSGASAPSSVSSSTECNGVSCTTTTVTRDADGNIVAQTDKTEKQESFCKENPTSALCKQSSFGGQCSAITCEGDAIQCAIAADQYKRNCQWFDDPKAAQLAATGEGYMTGEDQPAGHPAKDPSNTPLNFSTVIDRSDPLGASCPTDVSVQLSGKAVVIPFSRMCENLQLVGNLMVGFCMFVAALIVFRS